MPVPVPRASHPPVHQVHKHSKTEDASKSHSSALHYLKHPPPVSPIGPPSLFGSGDQWLSSLPAWRRTRSRPFSENDTSSTPEEPRPKYHQQRLTSASDTHLVGGNRAELCLPPLSALFPNCGVNTSSLQGNADRPIYGDHIKSAWGITSSDCPDDPSTQEYIWPQVDSAFAPVLEDDPEDPGSSPIGPMTPFAEYVDRAVAACDIPMLCDVPLKQEEILYPGFQCYGVADYQHPDLVKQGPISLLSDSAPSASMKYKKFAEPMADWIVSYVWKVCNNSIVLPAAVSKYSPSISSQPAPTAPMHLSASVHSLLMSTLLQPSAILLAMWYIARLPIYFSAVSLDPEQVKEQKFRAELLDTAGGIDGKTLEANATFRLIVLGCMLANKWLDDHTFSNKTWHTICKLPVHSLNKLESLALDIFSHDLTLSPVVWDQWLGYILSYHLSLSPPSHAQPISRPSSNSQSIIQSVIEEIREAPIMHSNPQPVFLSFERRNKDILTETQICDERSSEYDIDLDEDGPLREEYLPRRRVSNGSTISQRPASMVESARKELRDSKADLNELTLPPPSKWSPAGDEPIRRVGDRPALYMPVQPSIAPLFPNPVPAVCWAPAMAYMAVKQCPDYYKPAAPSNDCFYSHAINPPSRPCCSAYAFSPNSGFWYPQVGFHYQTNNSRSSFDGTAHTSQPMASWPSIEPYGPATRVLFGLHPPINHPATWIRA